MYFIDILFSILKRNKQFLPLFFANFFVSLHVFVLTYINSSFLAQFIDSKLVGAIYILAALLSMASIFYANRLIAYVGNYRFFFSLVVLELFTLLGLALSTNQKTVVPLFIAHFLLFPLMTLSLDIFLESTAQKESGTGSVRGAFLTIANIALILSPLVAGFLVFENTYYIVYFASALALTPLFFLLVTTFKKFKDPAYKAFNPLETVKLFTKDTNLKRIFMSQFFMRFFFSWMVIYMPLYLHEHIGFSWSELGFMFTLMLLPFALLEWPLGKLADTFFGEKEILSLGFVIMAISTAIVPFMQTQSIVWWTLLLVTMRVGAASVEIMTETYFFKHVDGHDSSLISFFRTTRPLAYVVGPIVAIVALTFTSLQFIFLLLACVLFYALHFSLNLVDTK